MTVYELMNIADGLKAMEREVLRLRKICYHWDICPDCGGKLVDRSDPEHRQQCPHRKKGKP